MAGRWVVLVGAVLMLAACTSAGVSGRGPAAAGTSAVGGAASASASERASGPASAPERTPGPASAPASAPATASATAGLSDEQAAGQRVVYSYPGPTPPEALLRAVREGRVGGVIFFAENVVDVPQFRAAVAQLRQAQQESPVRAPLLLMTDQEGGRVRRVPGPPDLSAKETSQAADPVAAAARAGGDAGRNLAGLGLNTNLAPVLDVYSTPGDFIDAAGRSYGSDARTVGTLGAAFLTAQQKAGVAATAKHFPGLGAAPAGRNTDDGPVTLPVSLTRLREVDEAPYRAAIRAGVRMVMLSWAVYPALDAGRPAGMSPVVVGQELRGRLGYRGVTVSDALEAEALDGVGPVRQRALATAAAGVDLLLCSARDVAQGDEAAAALAAALRDGTLARGEFEAALARVTALRTGLA